MLVATVEFMDRVSKVVDSFCFHADTPIHIQESVPGALTKDKKRIHGEEIAVLLAWKSTLYVTNFPESADDIFVRDLFEKVCVIGYLE